MTRNCAWVQNNCRHLPPLRQRPNLERSGLGIVDRKRCLHRGTPRKRIMPTRETRALQAPGPFGKTEVEIGKRTSDRYRPMLNGLVERPPA